MVTYTVYTYNCDECKKKTKNRDRILKCVSCDKYLCQKCANGVLCTKCYNNLSPKERSSYDIKVRVPSGLATIFSSLFCIFIVVILIIAFSGAKPDVIPGFGATGFILLCFGTILFKVDHGIKEEVAMSAIRRSKEEANNQSSSNQSNDSSRSQRPPRLKNPFIGQDRIYYKGKHVDFVKDIKSVDISKYAD
ncbi:MAG: hypothetical protein ACFFCS_29240, partial [Candidatus Hodarchaeota archaeon]